MFRIGIPELVLLAMAIFLLVVPLVGAIRRRQPVWALVVVLLNPLGGLLWLLFGRREPLRR
jgi:hypothetical protein